MRSNSQEARRIMGRKSDMETEEVGAGKLPCKPCAPTTTLVETPASPVATLTQVTVNLNTVILFEDNMKPFRSNIENVPKACLCWSSVTFRNLVMPTVIFLDMEMLSRSNKQRHIIKFQCLENSLPLRFEPLCI